MLEQLDRVMVDVSENNLVIDSINRPLETCKLRAKEFVQSWMIKGKTATARKPNENDTQSTEVSPIVKAVINRIRFLKIESERRQKEVEEMNGKIFEQEERSAKEAHEAEQARIKTKEEEAEKLRISLNEAAKEFNERLAEQKKEREKEYEKYVVCQQQQQQQALELMKVHQKKHQKREKIEDRKKKHHHGTNKKKKRTKTSETEIQAAANKKAKKC
jgi:hypothetical protein